MPPIMRKPNKWVTLGRTGPQLDGYFVDLWCFVVKLALRARKQSVGKRLIKQTRTPKTGVDTYLAHAIYPK